MGNFPGFSFFFYKTHFPPLIKVFVIIAFFLSKKSFPPRRQTKMSLTKFFWIVGTLALYYVVSVLIIVDAKTVSSDCTDKSYIASKEQVASATALLLSKVTEFSAEMCAVFAGKTMTPTIFVVMMDILRTKWSDDPVSMPRSSAKEDAVEFFEAEGAVASSAIPKEAKRKMLDVDTVSVASAIYDAHFGACVKQIMDRVAERDNEKKKRK